jgi:hypothetical protein
MKNYQYLKDSVKRLSKLMPMVATLTFVHQK